MGCSRPTFPACAASVPLLLLLLAPLYPADAAPVAKITGVVLDVTYQSAPGKAWTKCKVGTQLASGSRVRTASRSKCEIKFPSGSLVRLSPHSDLMLTSVGTDRCKLVSGQVLANAARGSGLRIEGASGTAAVQGTWVLFNGEQLEVWQGQAELQTSAGTRQLGDQERAGLTDISVGLLTRQGATLGTVTAAIVGGELVVTWQTVEGWELVATSLYAGTSVPETNDPELFPYRHDDLIGATGDRYSVALAELTLGAEDLLYLAAHARLRQADEQETELVAWGEGTEYADGPSRYFVFNPVAEGDNYPWTFPTGTSRPWWFGLRAGTSTQSTPGTSAGLAMRESRLGLEAARGEALADRAATGDFVIGVRSAGLAGAAAGAQSGHLGLATALAGALGGAGEEGFDRLGQRFYGPDSRVDLVGLLYDGGSFVGTRARASGVYRDFYLELGGQFSTQFEGELDVGLTEALVWWRQEETEIIAGRQHYLEGPVNNNTLGSLFGAFTFDGVRLHQERSRLSLDLAWVEDYRRNLVQAGDGRGWLARVAVPVYGGQVGATALRESGVGTGYSFDFSYPVLPGQLDLYGEVGQDPWGDNLQTWGAYFPGLYSSAQVDLFVEYARRDGCDSMWSALAYYDVRDDLTALCEISRAGGDDPRFALGVVKSFINSSR